MLPVFLMVIVNREFPPAEIVSGVNCLLRLAPGRLVSDAWTGSALVAF